MMKPIKVDLSEPFEKVLADVLAAPANIGAKNQRFARTKRSLVSPKQRDIELQARAEVKRIVGYLYEAAHGRQVQTPIGLIPIAPPVAAFLTEKPFYIRTQIDFLLSAVARIVATPARVRERRRAIQCQVASESADFQSNFSPPSE